MMLDYSTIENAVAPQYRSLLVGLYVPVARNAGGQVTVTVTVPVERALVHPAVPDEHGHPTESPLHASMRLDDAGLYPYSSLTPPAPAVHPGAAQPGKLTVFVPYHPGRPKVGMESAYVSDWTP
jgi:hypothetical protein